MAPPKTLTLRVSAPGKVILHGEHSVVYDKLAVAASLGLRTRLELVETSVEVPKSMALEFTALNLTHIYRLEDLADLLNTKIPLLKPPGHFNYTMPELIDHEEMVEVIRRFVDEKSGTWSPNTKQTQALTTFFYLFFGILGSVDLGGDLKQTEIKLGTELTVSAGTGSSASFAVTIAAAFVQFVKVKGKGSKCQYKSVKIQRDDSFDKADLDLISRWAFHGEQITHGTPSGVDNTICTYGSLVEFRRGQTPKLVDLSIKFNAILINTNISRDTRVLVQKVATLRGKHCSIVDGVLNVLDETATSALGCLKKINQQGQSGDEFGVLDYYEKLAELTEINQNLLRCLGVSHVKLDEACEILSRYGLHGKLTGAGGGGYAICLVPPSISQSEVDKVVEELNSKGFSALFTDLGGRGAIVDHCSY